MHIRPAQLEDADAIAQIHVQVWKETHTRIFPDSLLARLSVAERAKAWRERIPTLAANRQALTVGLIGSDLVGFAGCGRPRRPELGTDGEIYMINIVNRAKRRHLGAHLMRAMADALLDAECTSCGLWVLERNEPARAFYARLGGSPGAMIEDDHDGLKLNDIAILWPRIETLRERADAILSATPA